MLGGMHVRRFSGLLARAPPRYESRNGDLANNKARRFAGIQPASGLELAPLDFEMDCQEYADSATSGAMWNPDPRLRGSAGYESEVTADTVSDLCRTGHLAQAVEALGVLVKAHSCVSKSLLYTVLKRCGLKKDLVLGRRVHAFTVKESYESDTFLCNHILRMYASHGRLQDAMDVFSVVAKPDAFMWSSLISAHVQHSEDKQAIQLYNRMRGSSVKPDGHVFVAAIQACARAADLKAGQQVHADLLASGVELDLFVSSSLVDMYAKCGRLESAQCLFDGLVEKNVVTWNAMISGHSQQGMGQEALRLYSVMQEDGMAVPDAVTFTCLLQACASLGSQALQEGKQLHGELTERGYHADVIVANSLVNMYAKCGSLEDAQRVFEGLDHKDVVTWTTLVAGYSQKGKGQEALHLYSVMQAEGVAVPNSVTFVCLLQACASVGTPALETGKQLHWQIRGQGHEGEVSVANSLVNMYAKCGSVEDARSVFDSLGQRDVVTWSAMMAGYSQQGMGHEAFGLYRAMQEEGIIAPNSVTFVCLLQACASLGAPALDKGMQLHAQIRGRGLQSDVAVARSLVNMYGKCVCLQDGQRAFDRLGGHKDVVAWTALIAGYSQQHMGQEALRLYTLMQEDGMSVPDSVTFGCLLQACASVGSPALDQGKELHTEIKQRGYQGDVFVANSLVDMYAKCGSMESAQTVFDGLGQKDVVTWNAMIARYSQQGMGQEALGLYSAMLEEGISIPDSVTFVCLLQACASVGTAALEKGKQLHAQIREQGYQTDLFVGTSLVNMYAKCGNLGDAQVVFSGLDQKDVVTWNALIAGCAQQGKGEEALHLYSVMQEDIAVPNCVTFLCLLQACASVGITALEKGKQLHVQIRERGHEADVFVANSLVNMYAKCGSLEDAQRLFDGLGHKDVVTWNAMIAGYCQQGMGHKALSLYKAMEVDGMAVPDSVTFVCLLQACADVAALNLGRELHAQIEQQGLQSDVFVARSLVNMYGKSGSMLDAQQVFEALSERNVVAWNALIVGYSHQGNSEEVFNLVLRMGEDGIQPDGITFLGILTVCSHTGLVSEGRQYFEAMSNQYGITPTAEHYTCMVDLLGRAGQLDEALALVSRMPFLPNTAVWHTLLCACRKWGNVEVGRHAFEQAVKSDKLDASAYVLMSNIYTSAQMWEQAQEMQTKRIALRAWKQPGQSWWTDMDGLVHSFFVGDKR